MKFLLGVLVTLALVDCASTSMTTYTDPDYGRRAFNKLAVFANTDDLSWREKIETKIVKESEPYDNFRIVRSMDVLPPTRTFSNSEINECFVRDSIDGYLVVTIGKTGVDKVYIPGSNSTETKGKIDAYGNYSQTSTTTGDGGYTLSRPYADFQVQLYDTRNGKKAWISTAFTGGNAYATFRTVINSFCGETVERLVKDGLLLGTKKEEAKKWWNDPGNWKDK